MSASVHRNTPKLSVVEPRGLAVRTVAYHRALAGEVATARVTHTLFDAAGRAVAQRDPRLFALAQDEASVPANLRTVYSLSGQALMRDSVDAGKRISLFGEAGQGLHVWDGASGPQKRMSYDAQLRLVAAYEQVAGTPGRCVERFDYAGPGVVEAAANRCGRLIRHDDPAGTKTWPEYGLLGTPLAEVRQFLASLDSPDWPAPPAERDALLEAESYPTGWTYDALGGVLTQTDARSHQQTLAYTMAGALRQSTLTLAGGTAQTLLHALDYNAAGQVLTQTAGNGVVTTNTYDPANGRLSRSTATRSQDSRVLQDRTYTYDPVGNVIQVEDRAVPVSYFRNRRIAAMETYTYDSLDQLIQATGRESASAQVGPALPGLTPLPGTGEALSPYTQSYSYDAGGNLTQLRHQGAQAYTRTMAVAPDSNRALAQEGDIPPDLAAGFDAHGNLLRLSPGGQALHWDARHQLRQVTALARANGEDDTEVYAYDGSGQRMRKASFARAQGRTLIGEVRYLPGLELHTGPGGEVWEGVIASGARALHWRAGRPVDVPNDQVRFTLTDHLGSRTLELDATAALISSEGYYPYGGTAWWAGRHQIEADYKTIRYSGKERDASGLYYYGFRYYAPWLTRWLNPDPAGEIDGLNVYAFVRNKPSQYIDTNGLGLFDCTDGQSPSADAERAYNLMFMQGNVWEGLSRGSETGLETITRISRQNLSILEGEIETEMQRKIASRISEAPTEAYWMTHFSKVDFALDEGVHFKSLVTLQKERMDAGYEGNSFGGNISDYANHDFAFFAMDLGGTEPAKAQSRFGQLRYHMTLNELGSKAPYTHMEASDLMRPNVREISYKRAASLNWLRESEVGDDVFENFKHRVGLRENRHADLLFLGGDMLTGLGRKIAVDLSSLEPNTQDAIVEWTAGDRPLENVGEIINAFYRPQIAVPGGLKVTRDKVFLKHLQQR